MSLTPSTPDYIIPKLKAETIAAIVKKGTRLDGRGLKDYRKLTIIPNYLPKADGSAYVKLGNTQVLVGVKMEVGTPYSDAPNEGVIVVSAEFVPMASPVFEPGPPDENAIELARVIDRSIRETHAIELEKLAIIPGKKVWMVWIDIYVLDHDGNLTDAASIGTLAALMTAKIPKFEITEDEQVLIDKSTYVGELPLRKKVVTVTIGKIKDALIVDPEQEEESVLDSKIMIAVDEDGVIAGIQKAGLASITKEEAIKAAETAIEKGKEMIQKVTQVVQGTGEVAEEAEEEKVEGKTEEVEETPLKEVPSEGAEEVEKKEPEEEKPTLEEAEPQPEEPPKKEEAPTVPEEGKAEEAEQEEKPEEDLEKESEETESLKPSE